MRTEKLFLRASLCAPLCVQPEHLDSLLTSLRHAAQQSPDIDAELRRANVITWRGIMTKLCTALYEEGDGFSLNGQIVRTSLHRTGSPAHRLIAISHSLMILSTWRSIDQQRRKLRRRNAIMTHARGASCTTGTASSPGARLQSQAKAQNGQATSTRMSSGVRLSRRRLATPGWWVNHRRESSLS